MMRQGWCNNIAWNVGHMDPLVFKLAAERYEFNKLESYRSIVPMIQLCWNLAKHVKMVNGELLTLLKYVILSVCVVPNLSLALVTVY